VLQQLPSKITLPRTDRDMDHPWYSQEVTNRDNINRPHSHRIPKTSVLLARRVPRASDGGSWALPGLQTVSVGSTASSSERLPRMMRSAVKLDKLIRHGGRRQYPDVRDEERQLPNAGALSIGIATGGSRSCEGEPRLAHGRLPCNARSSLLRLPCPGA
jgi:hypothetical protein